MNGFKEICFSFLIGFASLYSLAKLNDHLKSTARLETPAEPTTLTGLPADPKLALNWGLKAINADQAWAVSPGSHAITVAIIDTGCDINHPDLQKNLWVNPGETGIAPDGSDRSTNGIDDDGNGFVDDVHGWDFVTNSPALMDEHGHGTHIAGIIGSAPPNGLGANGVAPRVSLMILKYYDTRSDGFANLGNTIRAIHYAIRMGANIINYSGGGIIRNRLEEEALALAAEKGILVVAAAGNEGVNSDFFHFYPADYDLPNILSVGAADRSGGLMAMSNYGVGTVDIAAPGKNIYSTLPNGQYGYMSGTSQATAFVSGTAALIMAQDESLRDPRLLIPYLQATGRTAVTLRDKVAGGKMLDAGSALNSIYSDSERVASRGRTPSRAAN